VLQIFLDTQGPQITSVEIPGYDDYDLFDPKPSENGPTPLAHSLAIQLRDFPERSSAFLYNAIDSGSAGQAGRYLLVGDHVGAIPIGRIIIFNDPPVAGEAATATITLPFNEPLPDDRYTLKILDTILDLAGNRLDGELNAIEPDDNPLFPSGDGVSGGDLVAHATPGPHEPWFFDPAHVAGGVVLQLGVHGIDLIRHLFGAIVSVVATTATVQAERNVAGGTITSAVEDEALATYRFASDVLGSHEMSFNEAAGTDRFRLEIYCADATLLLRGTRGPLAIHAPRLLGEPGWFMPALPAAPLGARQHARWLDILRGKIASDPTAEDALEGQRVAEAIYRAAATRQEQRLAPAQGAA
jgi:hypothetical protein